MNKKFLIFSIIILIIAIIVIGSQSSLPSKQAEEVFHITLANPEQYQNGVYSSTFAMEKGEYKFRFVPNGDSPKILTISLEGEEFRFSENFILNGTLHKTEISEYYTWDYDGVKKILVPIQSEMSIDINPNGNVKGSVSVDIIRN